MTGTKPQILFLGSKVTYALRQLEDLKQIAEIISVSPSSKEEVLKVFKQYPNIEALYLQKAGVVRFGGWTDEIIAAIPPSVKYANCHSAGYDWTPVEKFGARGIQCSNINDPVAEAVSDTAVYLMLGALRKFNQFSNSLRAGKWKGPANLVPGNDPEGKVLGIIGMGGIGRRIRDKSVGYDFSEMLYYNRSRLAPHLEKESKLVSLKELLARSDIIVLALPLTPKSRHLLNKDTLAQCKDGVIIVNIARGAIIDEQALVDALASGKVSNVGLDVFENEPHPHPELVKNENAVLLPHIGTYTFETRIKMEALAMDNVRKGLETGKIGNLVPELRHLF